MAYNQLAAVEKADAFEARFPDVDLREALILSIGDSSFAHMDKNRIVSQAGLIPLIADNADNRLLCGEVATVSPLVWKSRCAKRAAPWPRRRWQRRKPPSVAG